ncbi:MAG: hypothetical protein ABIO57_02465 [Candidatus Paceibacterota bacterium]
MEKKIFDIPSYPGLQCDTGVSLLHQQITELDHLLATKIALFKEEVDRVQKSCDHVWQNNTEVQKSFAHCYKGNNSYLGHSAQKIVVSRTCTQCAVTEIRPLGQAYQICYFCWSPMKFSRKLPSEDRESIYMCTNEKCNHGFWHT